MRIKKKKKWTLNDKSTNENKMENKKTIEKKS